MPRPIKNSCDYFSHDSDMRNHRKVKALRNTYPNGYAIWVMLLEYLTGCDGNEFEHSNIEFELISGDFGFPLAEISQVIDFCIRLEMLFEKDGFIYSETLNERLKCVYDKRGRERDKSKKKQRVQGKFVSDNTSITTLPLAETPQSKVKESKVKENSIYGGYVSFLNSIVGKKYRGDAKSKTQLMARLNGGYKNEDIKKAIVNASKDQFHIDNKFKFLTPEFFTRADKIDKFMNMELSNIDATPKVVDLKNPNEYINPSDYFNEPEVNWDEYPNHPLNPKNLQNGVTK